MRTLLLLAALLALPAPARADQRELPRTAVASLKRLEARAIPRLIAAGIVRWFLLPQPKPVPPPVP